ncbi:septal ring lytic transglycosylase RlpA family protein [Methylocella sp.]|uniref:septal ring lytic transglycosylase RlpA family protein n=1 Tax=Methylocella sp. TaxID=1978226 RepID=UPI003785284F
MMSPASVVYADALAGITDEFAVTASYYSSGKVTANGEAFDPDGFTAASRTMPFGTRLALRNPATGRTVVVRVNDRGPFIKGRDLDLARGAAEALGMIEAGVVSLKVARADAPAGRKLAAK